MTMQAFSANLYNVALSFEENCNENCVIGPPSIYFALIISLLGADGQTREEMLQAMSIPTKLSSDEILKLIQPTMSLFNRGNAEGPKLLSANKIFVANHFPLNAEYVKHLTNNFKAETTNVDFNQAVQTVALINKFVSDNTDGKITKLLENSSVNGLTKLVIVNAIYFKGSWETPFDKFRTREQNFYVTPDNEVKTPFMNGEFKVHYAELSDYDAKAIALRFKDSDLLMSFVLPNKKDGLRNLLKAVNGMNDGKTFFQNIEFFQTKVEMSIPKFKFEKTLDIKVLLQKMGVQLPFTDGADFTQLSTVSGVFISEIVHKAVIEVDEEGAEAAAATGSISMLCSAQINNCTFYAEHPFAFAILDADKDPIFVGHIKNFPA